MNRKDSPMNRFTRCTALLAFFAGLVPLYGCWDDSSNVLGEAHVIIGFTPATGGSFSATVDGNRFTNAGGWPVNLTRLGHTYEVTGSFTGPSFTVEFATSTSTGVETGSISSAQGPNAIPYPCHITYAATGNGPHQFTVRFKTTATAARVCP